MKISPSTLDILKNFSSINTGIHFKKGNVLVSVHPQKVIVGRAELADVITQDFVIYDLTSFLGVVGLGKDPEFEFAKNKVVIKEGKVSINYGFADPSTVKSPPEKEITMPSPDVKFSLTAEQIEDVKKASAILELEDLKIEGDAATVKLVAYSAKDPSSNTYVLETGVPTPHKFSFVFKIANLSIVPTAYDVEIKSGVAGHFQSKDLPIQYWVALEKDSKFVE